MHKLEYFIQALKDRLYEDRVWILRTMGVPVYSFIDDRIGHPSFIDGKWFVTLAGGSKEEIAGWKEGMPLFPRDEGITLKAGDMPNVDKETRTAYSTAILNEILFVWPFETPLPFMAERFSGKYLEGQIEAALKEGRISIKEYTENHFQSMGRLTVFTQISVTAATPKSIRPSKRALEWRDKILKTAKPEELKEPTFLAMIDQTVTAIDMEDMKDDEAARFFIKKKQYATARKKMFTIQGGVPRFDDPSKMDLLPTSLEEGLRPEDFPAAVNNLRSGSYGRAKDTALGGEAAKFASRVFQNMRYVSGACDSVVGVPVRLTKGNSADYEGGYLVGETESLTIAKLKSLEGKIVYIHMPATCKQGNKNVCARCVGDKVAQSGVSIPAQQNAICNVFMSVALAAFHGSSLSTNQVKLKDHLRTSKL